MGKEHEDADADERVGGVEGGPVLEPWEVKLYVDEITDITLGKGRDTVPDISDSAGDDQSEGRLRELGFGIVLPPKDENSNQGNQRENDEEQRAEEDGQVLENAEDAAVVLHTHNAQDVRDEHHTISVIAKEVKDQGLGGEVYHGAANGHDPK